MRSLILIVALFSLIAAGCSDVLIERLQQDDEPATPLPASERNQQPLAPADQDRVAIDQSQVASINGYRITVDDLALIESSYGLSVEPGDYWYDPVSGAWGYWGGPTLGFLAPGMDLGYPPPEASGGGTSVVLNGRVLHPYDLTGLEQLLGPISPGYYWLDARGFYGYEGGPAIGNLIYIAQGAGSTGGGGYFDSTYFGNIGSDGQTSYFYDSSSGCSVMSDGGVSC